MWRCVPDDYGCLAISCPHPYPYQLSQSYPSSFIHSIHSSSLPPCLLLSHTLTPTLLRIHTRLPSSLPSTYTLIFPPSLVFTIPLVLTLTLTLFLLLPPPLLSYPLHNAPSSHKHSYPLSLSLPLFNPPPSHSCHSLLTHSPLSFLSVTVTLSYILTHTLSLLAILALPFTYSHP